MFSLRHLIPLDHPLRVFYHKVRSIIAAVAYGFPANGMIVIGVTGTDGKTTTCNMITAVLEEAGYNVGMISTVNLAMNQQRWMNETKMTSMDPFMMNRYLKAMKKAGCQYVVLETSSHAIFYNRIWGVNYDVAVLTHISSDHLDLHRTLENYANTKKRLFTGLNLSKRKPNVPKVAVLNHDDVYFPEFDEVITDRKYVYGIKHPTGISAKNIVAGPLSTAFTLQLSNTEIPVKLPLPGSFNVYNALAAASVGISQNISATIIVTALEKLKGVPGRMELIKEGQPFHVIVDYAHTRDALEKVLSVLRPIVTARLWHVFGATGDRDKTKRPFMGKISDNYADEIIVTDDDPYTEDRMEIIRQVVQGIERKENDGLWVIPDRDLAIKTAITLAGKDDLVLITGKGAEQVLVTNQGKIPWDDRELARKFIRERMKL